MRSHWCICSIFRYKFLRTVRLDIQSPCHEACCHIVCTDALAGIHPNLVWNRFELDSNSYTNNTRIELDFCQEPITKGIRHNSPKTVHFPRFFHFRCGSPLESQTVHFCRYDFRLIRNLLLNGRLIWGRKHQFAISQVQHKGVRWPQLAV